MSGEWGVLVLFSGPASAQDGAQVGVIMDSLAVVEVQAEIQR